MQCRTRWQRDPSTREGKYRLVGGREGSRCQPRKRKHWDGVIIWLALHGLLLGISGWRVDEYQASVEIFSFLPSSVA